MITTTEDAFQRKLRRVKNRHLRFPPKYYEDLKTKDHDMGIGILFHKFIDRKATKQDLMDFTDKIDELLASALDTYNDTLGDAGDFGGVFFLGTNQEQNKSSSFAIIGVGAILLMFLTIAVTSVIMRRNNGEEEIDYDSEQFSSITNIQGDISQFSESVDVIDPNIETELEPDENGYYWKEYPEGSGLWYYRGEHDSEWVYWDS